MSIVWFKPTDLRVRDHEPLYRANKSNNNIIHLFVWDCRWDDKNDNNILIMGKFRKKFMKECLENLIINLKKKDIDLNIFFGKTEDIIINLIKKYSIKNIYAHQNVSEEIEIAEKINKTIDFNIQYFWGNTMYHICDLPFTIENLPKLFNDFKKNSFLIKVRNEFFTKSNNKSVKLSESINLNSIDIPNTYLVFEGGEDKGWLKLKNYFYTTESLTNYSSLSTLTDNTSNLSAWLSFGCLSAKSIFFQIKIYEKRIKKNNNTYHFYRNLLMRDYLKLSVMKEIKRYNSNSSNNKYTLKKWMDGHTGYPIIDSIATQLKNTGFISEKARFILASFLINDLNIDLYLGVEYFKYILIDYDYALNLHNWEYLKKNKIYINPIKQAILYGNL